MKTVFRLGKIYNDGSDEQNTGRNIGKRRLVMQLVTFSLTVYMICENFTLDIKGRWVIDFRKYNDPLNLNMLCVSTL